MAAERAPSGRAPTLSVSRAGLVALLLAVPGVAYAFAPGQTNVGGAANQAGPFANPFPDAGSTNGPAAPGTVPPPDYRYQGTLPLVVGGLPTPGFTVVPQVTLQEEFTDNVLQTETDRQWDLITLLTPSLTVGANTPRLNLSLEYAPTIEYYARTSSQNTVAHQLLGVGSLVVVPDTLFVDARGFATVAPTNGGYVGPGLGTGAPLTGLAGTAGYLGTGPVVGRQGTTQIFGESVSPYLVHRFGDFASGTIGASVTHTSTSSTAGGGSQQATTEDVNGQLASGSVFGRVQDILAADASRTQGTGVLDGARQETITDQLGYALTRQLQVFGVLGYEDIQYSGPTGERISDMVWRVGGTYAPNARSQITLSYGHSEGVTDFAAQASYALTARTTLTASYSQGITTYLQQVAAGLNQAGVNQNGVPINAATGLPLTLTNGALAVQDTVYRTRILALGITTLLDRDTIAFSFDHTEETPVSAAPGGGFAQRANIGTASWTRALSERATASALLSYGTTSTAGLTGDSDLFSASAQFIYRLSPTLTASGSYLFFERRSTEPGFSMYENIALVGLSKRF